MAVSSNVGVILLQLGTPSAPTSPAVRTYLKEFLWDPRVIDLPRAVWWPILNFSVLTTRPKQSAKLYQSVWSPDGSPLAVISEAQAAALEASLSQAAGIRVPVVVGMRYGAPSIESAAERLLAAGVDRILALPMYPQYASATTGSSVESLFDRIKGKRVIPALRVVAPYFDDADYVRALATTARESLATIPAPGRSRAPQFPRIAEALRDTRGSVPEHCKATARLLAKELATPAMSVEMTFQSRFGREEWLQPYTDVTLEAWGREKINVAVMSPGFTADCLETLEEIAIRGREQFQRTGGAVFHRIPCLNDHPAWIAAMHAIVMRDLGGWIG